MLKTEHCDLDIVIQQLTDSIPVDFFLRLNHLKKRKVFLKGSVAKLEGRLLPDIIA